MMERVDIAGWRFQIPDRDRMDEALLGQVLEALDGKLGAPFRRSRHATTWKVRVADPRNIFVKQLDAPRSVISRAKATSRAKRSVHVLRISRKLRRFGLEAPQVLLIGTNRESGNEVVVTSEAPGFMVTRWMNPAYHTELVLRRAILGKLGSEIARLHRSGFIHGDLTPYNVFATADDPIIITFIDNEGTERTSQINVGRARNRMRNLMQLGHFDIQGVSRTDKLRVFMSYADGMDLSPKVKRRSLRKLIAMIARRRDRDAALNTRAIQPAMIAQDRAVRG